MNNKIFSDSPHFDSVILEVRTEINILDEKIVSLLKKRFELAIQAEEIKKVDELPHLSEEREQVVLKNVTFGLSPRVSQYVQEIYSQILTSSRDLKS